MAARLRRRHACDAASSTAMCISAATAMCISAAVPPSPTGCGDGVHMISRAEEHEGICPIRAVYGCPIRAHYVCVFLIS
ncbi:hypothetical protein U9M48_002283 [Paspalum notatum var. saurae]|uniref:Uncharacterized protein n=1 Tax=Paspalum notatum var. saurae TaxID=547442 RepID=A0AAQ3SFX2_PASNO